MSATTDDKKQETQVQNTQAQELPQHNNKIVPEVAKETDQDRNWRLFREGRDADRKRAEAEAKRADEKAAEALALKDAMEAILNKQQPQQRNQDDNDGEETEEQRIDRRVEVAIRQRESSMQKEREERERNSLPQRLNEMYPDFDRVCSQENIDHLEFHYPEIASAFKHAPESLEKWSNIYKTVKRFNPNPDSKKDSMKAEKNLSKPQSMSSGGSSQEGKVGSSFHLDEQRKKDNWSRMQRTLKGLS
jgi:hypothetical protein